MVASNSEAAILERMIRPEAGDMPPEAARVFLAFAFAESDHQRMAELSDKARDGSISSGETAELDRYINISHFMAYVQSKARVSLRNARLPGAA